MRMLLWTQLLKKTLSPISARTPVGPAKPSTPPPGYTEKYVAPLAKPTAVWNPVGAPWLVHGEIIEAHFAGQKDSEWTRARLELRTKQSVERAKSALHPSPW
jgi:hypothetical protein